MEDSWDKINIRAASIARLFDGIIYADDRETLEKINSEIWQIDSYRTILEFGELIKENNPAYMKCLEDVLISYTALSSGFDKYIKSTDKLYKEKKELAGIVSITIGNIIEQLKGLIKPKTNLKAVKTQSFEDLFTKKEDSVKVIKILTEAEYLISGKWTYSGINKSIAIPFRVLRDYFGLINEDGSPLGTKLKTWCFGLGITADDSFIKNLKKNPEDGKNPTRKFQMAQKEFFMLFKSHFQPIRELV